MAPLANLLQNSPLEFAFGAVVVLLASCFAAQLLIYIGLRTLGLPADAARSMLISIRRSKLQSEPGPELKPIPAPTMLDELHPQPIHGQEQGAA